MACSKTGTVPKRPQPNRTETNCDVVHCPTVGNEHWSVNSQNFPFGGTRNFNLTNIDYMCLTGNKGSYDLPYEIVNGVILAINNPNKKREFIIIIIIFFFFFFFFFLIIIIIIFF